MARRGRSRLQPGRTRSAATGAVSAAGSLSGLEPLSDAIVAASEGVAAFTKGVIESSVEVSRATAAFHELSSTVALSSLQEIAGAFSSTAGSLVGGFRKGLGNLTAEAATAQDVEQLAVSGAAIGVPYSKSELDDFAGLYRSRNRSIEDARQLAHDVTDEGLKKEVGVAGVRAAGNAVSRGLGDALPEDIAHAIAHEVGSVLRDMLFGHGGR